ncbi:MAG: YjbQ family protein [Spirochaetes bacterium]|jgi:secondary thiamine-phosphate synthase enzyme|nr:YjbQ family protein [Spirochaetota bacterium]
MQHVITFPTNEHEVLIDITQRVEEIVADSGVTTGICAVYSRGATAGIMIQENWDDSVQQDVLALLRKLAPQGVWLHDRQDGNADSHLKSALLGASESIPVIHGKLGLSTWQNIFFCEFDGPRRQREAVVTVLPSDAGTN